MIIDIDGMILQGNVIDIGIDIVDVLRIQDKVEKKKHDCVEFCELEVLSYLLLRNIVLSLAVTSMSCGQNQGL